MNTEKQRVHFIDSYLLNPTNPVSVTLIGAGGTGSQVLTALARINHALVALNHAGITVRVFDADVITKANLGRQLFARSELGLPKAVALVNRINRFFGTNWKAIPHMFTEELASKGQAKANITISCVDTAAARFEIADILTQGAAHDRMSRDRQMYWMDFGNSRDTGQVILSTVGKIKQPASKKYIPVDTLPLVTDEFKALLLASDTTTEPSCSLAEALTKQDLFINSALANVGASLLWSMFRQGIIYNRGFFLNLSEFRTQPLRI